jgi:hypothetical protein
MAIQAPTSAPAARTAATTRLDPTTIEALQKRLRALLPPQLAAFSRAFRSALSRCLMPPPQSPG